MVRGHWPTPLHPVKSNSIAHVGHNADTLASVWRNFILRDPTYLAPNVLASRELEQCLTIIVVLLPLVEQLPRCVGVCSATELWVQETGDSGNSSSFGNKRYACMGSTGSTLSRAL